MQPSFPIPVRGTKQGYSTLPLRGPLENMLSRPSGGISDHGPMCAYVPNNWCLHPRLSSFSGRTMVSCKFMPGFNMPRGRRETHRRLVHAGRSCWSVAVLDLDVNGSLRRGASERQPSLLPRTEKRVEFGNVANLPMRSSSTDTLRFL